VIVCPKCGKENQDHYKFCLGCGSELPRDGGRGVMRQATPASGNARNVPAPPNPFPVASQPFAPQPAPPPAQPFAPSPPQPAFAPPPQPAFAPPPQPAFAPPPSTPVAPPPAAPAVPQPVLFAVAPQPPAAQPFAPPPTAQPDPGFAAALQGSTAQAPAAPPAPAPVAPAAPASCLQCGSPNPRGNRFCITCGFDMAAAPAAPSAQAPSGLPSVPVVPVAPVAPTPPAQPRAVERGRLVLILPNGSEGGTHALFEGDNVVGRDAGGVFAQDSYLSPRHATFVIQGSAVTVRDEASLNGVYVRVERQVPVELHDGDVFRIGQEILKYEAFPSVAREADGTEPMGAEVEGLVGKIALVTGRESSANAFPVPVTGLYLGRERGDILFPEDGYVSGLHCQLAVQSGKLTLMDVGSSNGTYLRLRAPRALRTGDFLLLGQQLFRLQLQ